MDTLTVETKRHEINLYPIGDFHLGSKNCAEKSIEKAVEIIANDPKALVLLMGDLTECIAPVGDKRYDTENIADKYRSNPIEKQILRLREILKPIQQRKYIGSIPGNHEITLSRRIGYDIARRFAEDDLKIRYLGFTNLIKIQFPKGEIEIFATHGSGSARTVRGRKRKLWHLKEIFKADGYIMGHYHDLISTDDIERRAYHNENTTGILINDNSSIKWEQPERKPYYFMSSSFYKTYMKGTTSYSERALYDPLKVGMLKITIKNGEITGTEEIYLD